MADSSLNNVNTHCLDNIMKLAETTKVTASEAIYDTQGTKLWAAGAEITPALKDRLLRHKLRKPLETSISVSDAVTAETVLAEAKRLLEEIPALRVIMGEKQAHIFKTLSQITLHPVAALLLTVADKSRADALRHGALVALIAVSLGAHHRLTDNDQALLALTGLIHDLGLLYIQPDYLLTNRPLRPEEWKHMAAHPLIGQIVLGALTGYPKPLTDAVAAHHERLDGSGYPRQLSGRQIGPIGQILAMAETLSGIFTRKDDILNRACLAIKCVPGEYPPDLISTFSTLKRNYSGEPLPVNQSTDQAAPKTIRVVKTLAEAMAECEKIAQATSLSPALADLLDHVKLRLAGLRQALRAAGIEECLESGQMSAFTEEDYQIFLEIDVVGREIGWRQRDTARDLYLRLGKIDSAATALFSGLIEILDNPENI